MKIDTTKLINDNFTICVDFDNTLVDVNYPTIIGIKQGARETLEWLRSIGVYIIISSCRYGEYEDEMRQYLVDHSIPYDSVNENNPSRIDKWHGDCRKMSADIYIDDKAYPIELSGGIIWTDVQEYLVEFLTRKYGK